MSSFAHNIAMRGEELDLSADSYDDHFYNSLLELSLQPQEEHAWDLPVSSVSLSKFNRIRQGLQVTTRYEVDPIAFVARGRAAFSVLFRRAILAFLRGLCAYCHSIGPLSLALVLSLLGNNNAIMKFTADMEFDRH